MNDQILKVAVVGCGARGKNHLDTIVNFPDVDIVAICDPVQEARTNLASAYKIKNSYGDINEMISHHKIDMAVVATPAHLNGACALPVIEAGIHTLMEKPPGLSGSETKILYEASKKSGAKVLIGWNRRFNSLIREAKLQIEKNGPITQIVGEFHKSMTQLRKRGYPDFLLDNFIYETPIHALDLIRFLANGSPVEDFQAYARRATSDYVDVYAALIRFTNGCVAQFTANFTTAARLERYEIHGKDCSAYLEGIDTLKIEKENQKEIIDKISSNGTAEQARFLIDCIKKKKSVEFPAASLSEAIKTMELADQIRAKLVV